MNKMVKWLYFHCNEKSTLGHWCKDRTFQVLTMCDDGEDEGEDEAGGEFAEKVGTFALQRKEVLIYLIIARVGKISTPFNDHFLEFRLEDNVSSGVE